MVKYGGTKVAGLQQSIIADPRAALTQARQLLASDPAAAEALVRTLLKTDSVSAPALRVLGRALRRLDRPEEAARAENDALESSTRNPEHRAAAQSMQAGHASQAQAILQRLLAEDESDVLALTMLGLHWTSVNEFEMAERLLRRAVDQAPDQASTRMALAELLLRSKRPTLALAELDHISGEAAATAPIMSLRAECLSALGRLEEELAILEPLASESAASAVGYSLRIGHALRSLGREPEAEAVYRGVTKRHPGEGTSWWSLANLKTIRFDDEDIAAMERALAQPKMPVQNAIRLHFALGKALEERRDAVAAFGHYDDGNRLRASIAPYDPMMIGRWVEGCVGFFLPEFYAARDGQGSPARDPIFIVGMQRSGSTLVEQILASHPAIEGTAELTDIPNLVRHLGEAAARGGRSFQRHLAALPADQLRALGESYLDTSRVHRRTDRPQFTDKMPNNWMHLGLIRLILPNARIIDVRREPLACCFSNWKQLYAKGLDHSNALDTMGRYYADYVRLMRHFDGIQPGKVHRTIYDDLVDDLEGGVRRLLDYLNVPFDPACLDFHANERAVHTISAGQVRKPINRDGIGQWKPYEQWLGPLKDALGDALDRWRD